MVRILFFLIFISWSSSGMDDGVHFMATVNVKADNNCRIEVSGSPVNYKATFNSDILKMTSSALGNVIDVKVSGGDSCTLNHVVFSAQIIGTKNRESSGAASVSFGSAGGFWRFGPQMAGLMLFKDDNLKDFSDALITVQNDHGKAEMSDSNMAAKQGAQFITDSWGDVSPQRYILLSNSYFSQGAVNRGTGLLDNGVTFYTDKQNEAYRSLILYVGGALATWPEDAVGNRMLGVATNGSKVNIRFIVSVTQA